MAKTRFKELEFEQVAPNLWRFMDVTGEKPAHVGPYYTTKTELLADLERYAAQFGCEGANAPAKTYRLKHRDALLAELAEGMKAMMGEDHRIRVDCIDCIIETGNGQTFAFGLVEVLDVLANDLHFDERGDWADVKKLTVRSL
jgi:hypothetical protein